MDETRRLLEKKQALEQAFAGCMEFIQGKQLYIRSLRVV